MPASADARADSHACDLSIMRKDWEEALERCDRAIQSGQLAESDLAHTLTSRCWAKVKLRRFDDALMNCNEALRLDPDFVGAYSNRASAHRGKGNYGRAIKDYDQALRLDPDYVSAYNNRGVAYNDLGEFDRAIEDFNQALRRDPDCAPAYYNRSNASLAKGDYDRVIEDCNRALGLDPNYVLAYTNRGTGYLHKADYDTAIQNYDQALRLDPNNSIAHWLRGVVYFYRGDFAAADADIAASVTHDSGHPYPALWLQLTRARLGKADARNLETQFERIGFVPWPGPIASYFLGQISEAELDAAAEDIDAEIQKQQMCEADFFVGEQHLIAGSRADAERRLRSAVTNCPVHASESHGAAAELARMAQ
jgi:lipoprotein NlpI